MTRDEFIGNYKDFTAHAISMASKSRREGLLALENLIDREKFKARDVFEFGIRFAVDGFDPEIINKMLTNLVEQENDEYARKFKTLQREAVLLIQGGINPRLLCVILNTFTDLPLTDAMLDFFTDPSLSEDESEIRKMMESVSS